MTTAPAESQSPPPATPVPRQRLATLALSGLVLLAGLDFFGPVYLRVFRPPADKTADFIQEWLSVRNYYSGHPIYESQSVSGPRHMPTFPAPHLQYNAHPPGSVLLALPFAGLSYHDAHFAWNLVTTPLLLLAVALAMRELCAPFRVWHLLPLAAVLVWAEPIRSTIAYGQLNFVLVFLLTAGWVCDRRGHPTAAGVFVGLAAGVKLFPAFVFAYFLFSGRWRGLIAGMVTAVAVNGVAAAAFGVGEFGDYVRDVLPSLEVWGKSFPNVAPSGLWGRLVNPPPLQAGPEAFHSPTLATAGGAVLALLVTTGVVWAARRSRRAGDPDLGWAAAVAALPLVCPIAWQHYYVLHVIPLAILAARLSGWRQYLGWMATAGMLTTEVVYFTLFISKAHRAARTLQGPYFLPLTPAENLLGTGIVTYCGVVLFLLALALPRRAPLTSRPSSSPAGTPS